MAVLSYSTDRALRRRRASPEAPLEAWRSPSAQLRPPGVVFEWRAPADRNVLRRLEIAAFVGLAPAGPLFQPTEISDWTQYRSAFGGFVPWAFLAYAVAGFFANQGKRCWVVRVAGRQAAAARLDLEGGGHRLALETSSPGTWGDALVARATPLNAERFDLTLTVGEAQEVWPGLTLDPRQPGWAGAVLRSSSLVRPASPDEVSPGDDGVPRLEIPPGGQQRFAGGDDGLAGVSKETFVRGLDTLAASPEVALLAIPDLMPKEPVPEPPPRHPSSCRRPAGPTPTPLIPTERPPRLSPDAIVWVQQKMVAQCKSLKDRIALLDPLPDLRTVDQLTAWRQGFATSYAALYAPWLEVPDPLRGRGRQALDPLVRAVPPSGHVAGVIARSLFTRGPAKPPANEVVRAARDVTGEVSDTAAALLNDGGINLIRPFPSRGIRIMGARTLSSEPALRYLNVRILLIYIEHRLEALLQPAVFEPNTPATWEMVERISSSLLDDLWQRGMLDGATAEEAYFVRCDETTNPPDEIDAGRLLCLIGIQPPWPAEFITVRIGHVDGSLTVLTVEGGPSRG